MAKPKAKVPHGDPWGEMPRCEAKTRDDDPCKLPAGFATDHVGQGRCKFHGGRSPIKHGRYASITRPRLVELLATLEDDPDPMDLMPEVILLRALILDYVERHDELTDAIIEWHESYYQGNGSPKPRQVPDILAVGNFVDKVGALVDRLHKQKQQGTITLEQLDRITEQLGADLVAAAKETVPDGTQRAALLRAVEERWNSIRVESGSKRP